MADVINNVKGTFSSWDSCMSKAYCKWPVIAAIVFGTIVILSVLWCVFSCLCCGITLCNACVKCITCGSCCGACSRGGGGGSKSRHKDDYQPMPHAPNPYHGYQPPSATMSYNQGAPQFASFDASSKKINEDSLPAMPSWDNARTKQVEDTSPLPPASHGPDVEMGRMPPARGGYSQVPPISPTHDRFDGDVGAQRMNQNSRGYSDFEPNRTLSPAPTYHTNPDTDRFMAGAAAPLPYQNRAMSPPQQQQPFRSMSPPQQQQPFRSMSPPQNHYAPQHTTPMPMPPQRTGSTAPYPDDDRSHQSSNVEFRPSPPPQQPAPNAYTSRSMSPPQSYTPYQAFNPSAPSQQDSGARPPSLLQVGRKPVAGSLREV